MSGWVRWEGLCTSVSAGPLMTTAHRVNYSYCAARARVCAVCLVVGRARVARGARPPPRATPLLCALCRAPTRAVHVRKTKYMFCFL